MVEFRVFWLGGVVGVTGLGNMRLSGESHVKTVHIKVKVVKV